METEEMKEVVVPIEVETALRAALAKKLNTAWKRIGYVKKSGYNRFHKYYYATEADIKAEVRKAMGEAGVVYVEDVLSCKQTQTRTAKGEDQTHTLIHIASYFEDAETGYRGAAFHGYGESLDTGDKGLSKARTAATKYSLSTPFLIPTGDDPEQDSPTVGESRDAAPPGPRAAPDPPPKPVAAEAPPEPQNAVRDEAKAKYRAVCERLGAELKGGLLGRALASMLDVATVEKATHAEILSKLLSVEGLIKKQGPEKTMEMIREKAEGATDDFGKLNTIQQATKLSTKLTNGDRPRLRKYILAAFPRLGNKLPAHDKEVSEHLVELFQLSGEELLEHLKIAATAMPQEAA